MLANDTDVDGDALTAVLVDPPTNGLVTLNADGSFTYSPFSDYHGIDTFTYMPRDAVGALGAVTTVTITVNPGQRWSTSGRGCLHHQRGHAARRPATGVLANDTDIDGGILTAAVADMPAHGDGGEAVGTVTITVVAVNDPPIGIDDEYTVDEDSTLSVAAPGVRGNDTDIDGNVMSVELVGSPKNGTVVLDAAGSFVYNPFANFAGADFFTYRIVDANGLVGNVVNVRITVRPAEELLVTTPTVGGGEPTVIVPEVFSGARDAAAPAALRFGELPRADTETVEVRPRAGELPRTGADPRQLSQFGALLVLLGSAARRAGRPRRRK